MDSVLTAAGWAGGLLMMVAYALVTLRYLNASGLLFQSINTIGAVLLGGSAFAAGAMPNAVISIIWAAVGVYAMVAGRKHSQPVDGHGGTEPSHDARGSVHVEDVAETARVGGASFRK